MANMEVSPVLLGFFVEAVVTFRARLTSPISRYKFQFSPEEQQRSCGGKMKKGFLNYWQGFVILAVLTFDKLS